MWVRRVAVDGLAGDPQLRPVLASDEDVVVEPLVEAELAHHVAVGDLHTAPTALTATDCTDRTTAVQVTETHLAKVVVVGHVKDLDAGLLRMVEVLRLR